MNDASPTSTPTPPEMPPPVGEPEQADAAPTREELLVGFQRWLRGQGYLICRLSFGDRKRVTETPAELADDFLSQM